MLRATQTQTRRHVIRALLIIACALAPLTYTSAQTPAKEPKDTGVIAGRITREGHAVADVLVTLMPGDWSAQQKPVAKTTSDADGRYRLANVPPGRYYLNPFAPAYVVSDINPADWRPGRMLNVAAGDKLEGLDFTLTRGGVITGRVTNADGKPVVETMVRVMAADEADRKKPQYSVAKFAFQTDDRGVYRLYGLSVGRYLVYIGESPEDGMVRVGGAGSYPRTFYGNTSDIAQAKPVEVTTGEEATAIDIVVGKPAQSYAVAGRVVDERGQPVTGASIVYGPINAEGRFVGSFGADGSKTNERGEFRLRGLSPNRYGLWAMEGQAFGGEQSANYSSAAAVEIIEQDVSGIEIKLTRGATLSGIVTVEGTTNPTVLAKLAELRLGANTRGQTGLAPPAFGNAKVNADGTFTLTGLRPGKTNLSLGWPQVKGFSLVRVQRDNLDQLEGIDIAAGERVTGVRVIVAYGASTVRGQVQFPNGQRPVGGHVHVEAHRVGTPVGTGNGSAEIDALGRFVLENLSAGEYELLLFADYPAFGTEQRKPPVDRKVVNVPETGDVQVTLVFKQEPGQ